MQPNPVSPNALAKCRLEISRSTSICLSRTALLFALCTVSVQLAAAQLAPAGSADIKSPVVPAFAASESSSSSGAATPSSSEAATPSAAPEPAALSTATPAAASQLDSAGHGNWFQRPVKQEFIAEGLVSYGNYKIFASGYDEKLFTGGVEYDRHSWGYLLKAQMDYVAEFLPFVLLDKPLSTDIWGNPTYPPGVSKKVRQYVPGIGFSPIGFRLLWRPNRKFQPYLEAKGGVLLFTHKVPSSKAAYENFSLQSAGGVQVKFNQRWGLRLGLFSDFHFSDAFVVPVNPGLDVMNANLGVSYHFGSEK